MYEINEGCVKVYSNRGNDGTLNGNYLMDSNNDVIFDDGKDRDILT